MPDKGKDPAYYRRNFGKNTIKKLSYYSVIEAMLRGGCSVERVAAYIQEERKDFPEVKRTSMIIILYRVRAAFPPEQVLPPSFLDMKTSELDLVIDSVQRLGKLIHYQENRLKDGDSTEQSIHMPLVEHRNNIDLLHKMLSQYTDLLMRLGVLKEKPLEIAGSLNLENQMVLKGLALSDKDKHNLVDVSRKLMAFLKHRARKEAEVKESGDEQEEETD